MVKIIYQNIKFNVLSGILYLINLKIIIKLYRKDLKILKDFIFKKNTHSLSKLACVC